MTGLITMLLFTCCLIFSFLYLNIFQKSGKLFVGCSRVFCRDQVLDGSVAIKSSIVTRSSLSLCDSRGFLSWPGALLTLLDSQSQSSFLSWSGAWRSVAIKSSVLNQVFTLFMWPSGFSVVIRCFFTDAARRSVTVELFTIFRSHNGICNNTCRRFAIAPLLDDRCSPRSWGSQLLYCSMAVALLTLLIGRSQSSLLSWPSLCSFHVTNGVFCCDQVLDGWSQSSFLLLLDLTMAYVTRCIKGFKFGTRQILVNLENL